MGTTGTNGTTHGLRSKAGWLAVSVGVLLTLVHVTSALAETPAGLPRFAGNYTYSGTREQGIAIVEKAMDPILSEMNMVMRLLAKKNIGDRFAQNILIEVPASNKVGMKVGALPKATQELDKTTDVKSEDGKQTGKLTFKFDGSKLTSTLAGDDGAITSTFTLSADGKALNRNVHVTSKRLKKPFSYTRVYKRK